jgi:hypothetical protein
MTESFLIRNSSVSSQQERQLELVLLQAKMQLWFDEMHEAKEQLVPKVPLGHAVPSFH